MRVYCGFAVNLGSFSISIFHFASLKARTVLISLSVAFKFFSGSLQDMSYQN